MAGQKEERIFESYLASKNLKHTSQRREIMNVFLGVDRHVSADELYRLIKKSAPDIGYATVYRTLKILTECGLGRELKFDDGTARYEHLLDHKHHDHLVCTKCRRMVEVVDPEIERLQERLFKLHKFYPERHRMELYGICRRCKR